MSLRNRPLAIIGFTALFVIFLSLKIDEAASELAIACGIILLIITFLIKKIRDTVFPFFIAAAMILGGFLFILQNDFSLSDAQSFVGDEASDVVATVKDYPEYSSSRYYYLVDVESVDGKDADFTMRLSSAYYIDAEPYDRIRGELQLYLIGNSSGEDVEQRFHSKKIYLGGYEKSDSEGTITVEAVNDKSLYYKLILLRETVKDRIMSVLPNEYGGTAVALLLGDKSNLSVETENNLYKAGVAPIFAVSGLHLSIWVMGLYSFLEQLKVKKRINSIINIIFALFFMALTGFSPSVCRSGLMMILTLVGNIFYRRSDSINSLGFATLVLCIINPFIASDLGFLMSFSATLGIVTLSPFFEQYVLAHVKIRPVKAILNALFVSIAAIIGSFPVSVFFIKYISVLSLVSGLIVTYPATVCMILSGFTAILFPVKFISDFTGFFAGLCVKFVLSVINFFADFSVSCISTADLFWKGATIVGLIVIVVSVGILRKKQAFRFICIGLSAVIAITIAFSRYYYDDLTQVQVTDVENGIGIIIQRNGKKVLLLGDNKGYSARYSILDSLNYNNRRPIDLVLISDNEAENNSTNLQLLKQYSVKRAVAPDKSREINQIVGSKNVIFSKSADLNLWEDGLIEFFSEDDCSYAYLSLDSITFLVLFKSEKDIEIPEEYSSADFLVCCGTIPSEMDLSYFDTVLISASSKKADKIKLYIEENNCRGISTADFGDISVDISDENYNISVKEG